MILQKERKYGNGFGVGNMHGRLRLFAGDLESAFGWRKTYGDRTTGFEQTAADIFQNLDPKILGVET